MSFWTKQAIQLNKQIFASSPHSPFFSALEALRLFLSCCTIGLSSFPAFSLCLLVLRLRPDGGTACSRLRLGGRVFPSSLYRRSISLLWNAWSSEISFMCLERKCKKRKKGEIVWQVSDAHKLLRLNSGYILTFSFGPKENKYICLGHVLKNQILQILCFFIILGLNIQ